MARDRIVFDVSMAKSGGGFTYAVNVLPVIARRLPNVDFLVVMRSSRIASSIPQLENLKVLLLPEVGIVERLRFLALEAPALARSFDADLYYSASEMTPFRCPCPKIAAFRNPNLFTDLPLDWPLKQRLRLLVLYLLARESARTCAKILFVSRDSADWIGDALGIPIDRRVAVPHGINPDLWSRTSGSSPIDREFMLSVSSIYRYKNFVRLIEAWTLLARRRTDLPDLVLVGDDQDPSYSRAMRDARLRAGDLEGRIHIVGEVPYAEIARYYRHAKAFIFPSYLETFGHPLLEAMAAGLPVVAADLGVFREIGGDAAIYFDPFDSEAMALAIERAVFELAERDSLIARGFERVASYSWDRTVDGMIEMFTEVLRSARRDS